MRRLSTRAAGLLILILGIWGGLVPFVGPYFHFALGPNHSWTWTSGRFWLSVLPAIVAIIGGLMLLGSGPRPGGKLGALLALAAGIWFAIGPDVSLLWNSAGATGVAHGSRFIRTLELLTYHTLLGTLIAALAGYALPGLVTRRAEAERELVAGEPEPVGTDRAAVGAEREPVAAEREPGAAPAREAPTYAAPAGATRVREDGATRARADGSADRSADGRSQTAVLDRPVSGEGAVLDRPVSEEARVRDRPVSEEAAAPTTTGAGAQPTTGAGAGAPATTDGADSLEGTSDRAADPSSPAPVTMRRRRGGLLSRLRN